MKIVPYYGAGTKKNLPTELYERGTDDLEQAWRLFSNHCSLQSLLDPTDSISPTEPSNHNCSNHSLSIGVFVSKENGCFNLQGLYSHSQSALCDLVFSSKGADGTLRELVLSSKGMIRQLELGEVKYRINLATYYFSRNHSDKSK